MWFPTPEENQNLFHSFVVVGHVAALYHVVGSALPRGFPAGEPCRSIPSTQHAQPLESRDRQLPVLGTPTKYTSAGKINVIYATKDFLEGLCFDPRSRVSGLVKGFDRRSPILPTRSVSQSLAWIDFPTPRHYYCHSPMLPYPLQCTAGARKKRCACSTALSPRIPSAVQMPSWFPATKF